MNATKAALQAQAEQHRQAAEAAEAATEWRQAVNEYEACLSLLIRTRSGSRRWM